MNCRRVVALALAVAACAGEQPPHGPAGLEPLPAVRAGAVQVSRVVMAEPVLGERSALYFDLSNGGESADTLTGVDVGTLGSASVHRTSSEGGVSRMRPAGPVELLPGASVALRPGGLHVMVENLSRPLAVGDTVDVRLVLARAGPVRARALVVGYADLEAVLEDEGG